MPRVNFDYTYHIYQEGIRIALPGTVKGSINWQGEMQAELAAEGMELPLDALASATMAIHPVTANMSVTGNYGERKVELGLDQLDWDILEEGEVVGAISLAPSKLAYSNKTRNWKLEIPSVSLNTPNEDEAGPNFCRRYQTGRAPIF